jgi:hypothetical protein
MHTRVLGSTLSPVPHHAQAVCNDTPRALSGRWSVLAAAHAGSGAAAFAAAPLRCGVGAGDAARVTLPLPDALRAGALLPRMQTHPVHAQCSTYMCVCAHHADACAMDASLWLLYAPLRHGAPPACFPAGHAARDVLHLAAPITEAGGGSAFGDGGMAAAAPAAADADARTVSLRLRVAPPRAPCTARDALAAAAGVAAPASASAAPPAFSAAARAALPGGVTLRAGAPRNGIAELTLRCAGGDADGAAVLALAREALLRRALRQGEPQTQLDSVAAAAPDADADDAAVLALRALRRRLVACQARARYAAPAAPCSVRDASQPLVRCVCFAQDALDVASRLRLLADAHSTDALPPLVDAAARAQAQLLEAYGALRGAPFSTHAAVC